MKKNEQQKHKTIGLNSVRLMRPFSHKHILRPIVSIHIQTLYKMVNKNRDEEKLKQKQKQKPNQLKIKNKKKKLNKSEIVIVLLFKLYNWSCAQHIINSLFLVVLLYTICLYLVSCKFCSVCLLTSTHRSICFLSLFFFTQKIFSLL